MWWTGGIIHLRRRRSRLKFPRRQNHARNASALRNRKWESQKCSDWGQSTPAMPDRAKSTPLTCDSAGVTPVQSAAALARSSDKPTWGTMRYYSDDVRVDKEWGQWGKDAVRTSRDDKMRGRSPPPKERKGSSGRMCEGGPWGEASAGSAQGWGSPRKGSPEHPSESFSPCPGKQESSSKSPKESPKPKRPWNRTRRAVRRSSSSPGVGPPNLSIEKEESTFLVRVQKGETEARVLFLNDQKFQGWEGPFDMSLTMEISDGWLQRHAGSESPHLACVGQGVRFVFWRGREWRVRTL